jgi:DNA-binding Lrp family transcriptional regulator
MSPFQLADRYKRLWLSARTIAVLNALEAHGPQTAAEVGKLCGMSGRCAGARLRWLAKARMVRREKRVWRVA